MNYETHFKCLFSAGPWYGTFQMNQYTRCVKQQSRSVLFKSVQQLCKALVSVLHRMAGQSEGTLLSAIVRPKRRPLWDHIEMLADLLLQDRHQNVFRNSPFSVAHVEQNSENLLARKNFDLGPKSQCIIFANKLQQCGLRHCQCYTSTTDTNATSDILQPPRVL